MTSTANERRLVLLPERLFSPAVFLVSLGWMSMMHQLDFENNLGIAPVWQREIVLIVVHFIAFAIPGAVYFALRSWVSLRGLVAALIPAVVVGAGVRGFAQFYGLDLISARPLNDAVFRIAASLTNASFAILVAWAGFSAAEQHKRRRQRLMDDRESLLLLRNQARAQLDRMDSGAAEQIRESLLADVALQSRGTTDEMVASMRRLIDDVVRPLSHYFEKQSNDWLPPEPRTESLKIDWRGVLGSAFHVDKIYVLPITVMVIWTSLPNTYFNRGAIIALIAVVHALSAFPIFGLIKRVGRRLSQGRSVGVQAAIFFFGLYLGGQILGLSAWIYTRFQEPHFFYAVIGPVYTLVGGSLIAFARTAIAQSESMEESLLRTGSDLRWSLARAREMHRQQRRALAHALHGQIQAAVASAILRLEMSSKREGYSPKVAAEIVESLKSTIGSVHLLSNSSVPIDVVLERISSTWSGIATVSADVESAIAERIANDSVCGITVNDVLTELTYNSIKHGSATEVAITLASEDERVLTVVVADNGQQLTTATGRGLGSALLDDCAIAWERTRAGGQTRTLVTLPLE